MKQYIVTGMSCAACSARVEKAVNQVPGVESCSVSLLTNSMGVEGTAVPSDIIQAVADAGYGASLKDAGAEKKKTDYTAQEEMLKDKETPVLKKRLITSIGFLAVLMYFSMGAMMWGWPLPKWFENNHVAHGLLQLILAAIVMMINQKFFVNGFKSLFKGAPNMDTLVALGSAAAFVYSTVALFMMTDAQMLGDQALAMSYMHEFYFESAAMILTLITVGKMLEARSKGKTTDALKGLMKLAPKTAVLIKNGVEVEVPIDEVNKGDLFVVRPGENIPVDGVVIEGTTAVNESALTGESIPVDKNPGDLVSAATLNQSGYIKCEARRVGEDTTLSQIIQMVSDAAATKAPIAKVADKVSGIFVPVVITIAVITTFAWLLAGQTVGFALARGISVLVISCPCALGLATPVAIMVGNGIGAKNGIMFKTAVSLEETGKIEIVALDKTGTITNGEPKVTDLWNTSDSTVEELVAVAFALEEKSEHPLAKAIVDYVKENKAYNCDLKTTDFRVLPGNGLEATIEDEKCVGGSFSYIKKIVKTTADVQKKYVEFAEDGKTPLFFTKAGKLLGVIAVADVIKKDSAEAIKQLENMGIHVVMLTGDNEKTANAIGKQAGVDEVIAGVLPNEKEAVIRALKEKGKVAMVGDGINDAPALTRADIGIAIGAGTDIAIDAADVVLMKSSLMDVPAAIRLSRKTLKNIHENLFWAFFYNSIGIPLAAGLFIPILGWELNPMFGAAAMSLSSFCVVSNALRLNFVKIYDSSKDRKKKILEGNAFEKEDASDTGMIKEDRTMEKTMKIEGMMCPHCEARVKKTLEEMAQVTEAVVSHAEGTAVVKLAEAVENDVLKKIIEDQGYKVLDIQ